MPPQNSQCNMYFQFVDDDYSLAKWLGSLTDLTLCNLNAYKALNQVEILPFFLILSITLQCLPLMKHCHGGGWWSTQTLIINVGQLQQHAASSTFDTKEMVSSTFSLSNLHVDLALTDTWGYWHQQGSFF